MRLPYSCTFALVMCVTHALSAFAAGPDAWIPARWEGGPLEVERRTRDGTLPETADLRQTIRSWYDPATLDLLRGTPINCLLVTWSAGGDPETEKEQQRLVSSYARAAQARGIAVLGLVHGSATTALPTRESAAAAGLDGVIILPADREQLTSSSDVFAVTGVAPGVRELEEEPEAAPSSEPWIDSNLWLVRSIRSSAGPRPVWLLQTLSPQAALVDYLRAIADADVGGGRWAIALSDDLRHGLRTNQPQALAVWQQIVGFLRFRQEHAEWYGLSPLAVCGFVQDSSGSAREWSGEHLNLAVRRGIPLRLIERPQLTAAALRDLRALHAIDVVKPTVQERRLLTEFAEAGGLVVVGSSWGAVEIREDQDFAILPAGKGRIVVFRDNADPAETAKALVDLLGRDNLGVRLFRASSVLSHALVEPGSKVLVHLLNYASYAADRVLVRMDGEFRSARFHTPGGAPQALALERSGERSEVEVPGFPVYGVLLLEK